MGRSVFTLAAILVVVAGRMTGAAADDDWPAMRTYVVHAPVAPMPAAFGGHAHGWYASLVGRVQSGRAAEDRMLHVYQHVFEGFAARLTADEARELARLHEVAAVVEDAARVRPRTTYTPAYLGLASAYDSDGALWNASRRGDGVIVGVLDTGIWPEERRSFSDAGLGPVPARWNGACESYPPSFDASSACNRKLIGARAIFAGYEAAIKGRMDESVEYRSPLDSEGHGTHTASTAAGSPVPNSSFLGFARGTASGTAPAARVAVYKVCWRLGCFYSDILKGFDYTIADGVDIISVSIGGKPSPGWDNDIAQGAFAASRAGILTVASAGNDGPFPYTVVNVAPWILTVAASSVDREFPASVTLGNGSAFAGTSLYAGRSAAPGLPLVYAYDAAAPGADCGNASLCTNLTLLDTEAIAGNILLCNGSNVFISTLAYVAREAGAAGLVVGNKPAWGDMLQTGAAALPTVIVGYNASLAIKQYIEENGSPTATLGNGVSMKFGERAAPAMAAFSSRGPSLGIPGIAKPDVTAPGLNVLAAWTGNSAASPLGPGGESTEFNVDSGRSMSCPHVSGVAALLRAAHRDWSPAMIKSALMTTAFNKDDRGRPFSDTYDGKPTNPWAYGSGHISPNSALDPGLVYDIPTESYVGFVCGIGGNLLNAVDCSAASSPPFPRPIDLNYPSFSVVFNESLDSLPFALTTSRALTNVGPQPSPVYTLVSLVAPDLLSVAVEPRSLSFDGLRRSASYSINFTFNADGVSVNYSSFGSLTWSDGVHNVTSPISFLVTA